MGIKQLPKPQTGLVEVDRVLNEHVDKLNPILRALPPASGGQFTQGAWNAPKFLNGWVNFGAGFATVAYMMDSLGFVHLRGLANLAAGSGGNPSVIFVLPVGFRPAAEVRFTSAGEGSPSLHTLVDVTADGRVVCILPVAVNGLRSLDGMTFDTRI